MAHRFTSGSTSLPDAYTHPYVRTDEAAAFIGLSPRSLANMRSQRIGPPYRKVGSRVLYRLEDLVSYVEAGRVETVA